MAYLPISALPFLIGSNSAGTLYVRLKATASIPSGIPAVASVLPYATGGGTPVALAASFTIASTTAVAGASLSFSASANGGTAPYSHVVQAENVDTGAVIGIGSANTPGYAGIWQNVPVGRYDLKDTITDAVGATKDSAVRRVIISAAPAAKLDPPTNLRQTTSTTTSVTMAWDTVPNATGYRLMVNGGTTYMPGTATTYTLTGLTAGSTSTVQVQALYSGTGSYTSSDYSDSVNAVAAQAAGTAYNFTLLIPASGASQAAYGMRLSGPPGDKIEFNRLVDDGSLPVQLYLREGTPIRSQLDFISAYLNTPFRYTTASGNIYDKNTYQNAANGITLS
jgi:hypothetical protein